MKWLLIASGFILCSTSISSAQSSQSMLSNQNPLLCDPTTGVCETNPTDSTSLLHQEQAVQKPSTVVYFTDPICSACWGIEPQLRKLKLEYGHLIHIEYHMGGLLKDWSYNSGGISKPSDVAHHWDEMSHHYQMPIDGDVWLEDPLHSSYPPSIAFKAAQLQDEEKAIDFLRVLREMVFLEKKNITKWMHIADAANQVGLDAEQLQLDYENDAESNFYADLTLSRSSGVRGFPTLFVVNQSGQQQLIYGARTYSSFEQIIETLHPNAEKPPYDTSWRSMFVKFKTLTTREFAELTKQSFNESKQQLEQLYQTGKIDRFDTQNGTLWKQKY